MFTDDELRQACRDLADEAPDVTRMVARLPVRTPRQSRAARLAPACVAVAVVALTVCLAVFLPPSRQNAPTPRPTSGLAGGPTSEHPCDTVGRPDLTDVKVGSVAGLASFSSSTSSCSGYAERELDTPAGFGVGLVRQYRKGVFDTRLIEHARRVSGNGIDGYLGTATQRQLSPDQTPTTYVCTELVEPTSSDAHRSLQPVPGCKNQSPIFLAWQYAPDSWALVIDDRSPFGDTFFDAKPARDLLRVAAAVDTAHPAPVRVPVAFDQLPDPLRAVGVAVFRNRAGRLLNVVIELGAVGVHGCPRPKACTIGEVGLSPRSHAPRLTGTPFAVQSRTAYLTDHGEDRPDITLELWTGRWLLLVAQTSDRPVDDDTLVAVARSASYARSTATATWFPAEDALPG